MRVHAGSPRLRFFFVLALTVHSYLSAFSSTCGYGAEWTAEELKAGLLAALESIDTVEGKYRAYFQIDKLPGAETGPDGLVLWTDFEWLLRRRDGFERLEGRRAGEINGRCFYRPVLFTWNGEHLITYSGKNNSGQRLLSPEMHFGNNRSPLVLMGRAVVGDPLRDLQDILGDVELIEDPEEGDGVYGIRSVFRNDPTRDIDEYEALVWIDTGRGFVPKQIEIRNLRSQTRIRSIEVHAIEEVGKGLWMPTKGAVTLYRWEPIFPDERSEAAYKSLKGEAWVELIKKLDCREVPLGFGTETYVVDVATLKVNQPISEERFSFEFPPGARVYDEATGTVYHIPPALVTTSRGYRLGLILLNVVGVALIVWLVLRRRKHR